MTAQPWRFWQLISAALPVGAFQYSQGLETAIEQGLVHDLDSAELWLAAMLQRSVAQVDLPLLVRIHAAWSAQDAAQVRHWDQWSRALRETRELREEEMSMGSALRRLGVSLDETLPREAEGFCAMFGVMAVNNRVSLSDTLAGYGWMWAENAALVATKLIPLGHTQAQQMLRRLADTLPELAQLAQTLADDELGAAVPGALILSAQHETQPSRLFRS